METTIEIISNYTLLPFKWVTYYGAPIQYLTHKIDYATSNIPPLHLTIMTAFVIVDSQLSDRKQQYSANGLVICQK